MEKVEEVSTIEIPQEFLEFNKLIGFPLHPRTKRETKLFQYELDILDLLKKYNYLLINKARKIGVSEIILRIIAYKCFTEYKGYQVMLVAGNREKHAQKLMQRFQKLFERIPDEITDRTTDKLVLRNDTEILAFPSTSSALRALRE